MVVQFNGKKDDILVRFGYRFHSTPLGLLGIVGIRRWTKRYYWAGYL